MAFNGAGVFNRLFTWVNDRNAAIKIQASRMDQEMDGFAAGLSNCITKDGQTQIAADIPFNGRKLTGLGTPVNNADSATKSYVDTAKAALTTLISGKQAALGFSPVAAQQTNSGVQLVWNGTTFGGRVDTTFVGNLWTSNNLPTPLTPDNLGGYLAARFTGHTNLLYGTGEPSVNSFPGSPYVMYGATISFGSQTWRGFHCVAQLWIEGIWVNFG